MPHAFAGDPEEDYKYFFVGSYVDRKVPQYGYYLGWSTKENKAKFYRTDNETTPWNHYSAIISAKSNPHYEIPEDKIVEGKTIVGNATRIFTPWNDLLMETPSGAKKMSLFLDESGKMDDYTTNLENYEVEILDPMNDNNIYDLSGKVVNANNLKKGIYIKNGKKFVVK